MKLCAEGMQAEAEGRFDDARALFTRAWELAQDDYDACIAAHYVARHQQDPADTLHWNRESLTRAAAVGDERVSDFYPSLYLNMGYSYERLGDLGEARRYYELAAEKVGDLPPGPYTDVVRKGIAGGLARTAPAAEQG